MNFLHGSDDQNDFWKFGCLLACALYCIVQYILRTRTYERFVLVRTHTHTHTHTHAIWLFTSIGCAKTSIILNTRNVLMQCVCVCVCVCVCACVCVCVCAESVACRRIRRRTIRAVENNVLRFAFPPILSDYLGISKNDALECCSKS